MSSFASSLPYSETVQKNPTAELTAMQSEWADHIAAARQQGASHAAPPSLQHNWDVKAGGHGRFFDHSGSEAAGGSSTTANGSSTAASKGDAEGEEGSSSGTGKGFNFDGPSYQWPSSSPWAGTHATDFGQGWNRLWSDASPGQQSPGISQGQDTAGSLRPLQTMLQTSPALTFDPVTPTPEPSSVLYLLAALLAIAFCARRSELRP